MTRVIEGKKATELPAAVRSRTLLMIGRVATGIRVRCFGELAQGKLRQRHHAILSGLRQFGEMSPSELARHLELDRRELSDCIAQLQAVQYLMVAPNPRDRRGLDLTLTTRGRLALEDFERELDRVEAEWLQPLSGEQRAALEAALNVLARELTCARESVSEAARLRRLATRAKPLHEGESERARRRRRDEEWERILGHHLRPESESAPAPAPAPAPDGSAQGQGMAEDL